jgi:hypothetical protein
MRITAKSCHLMISPCILGGSGICQTKWNICLRGHCVSFGYVQSIPHDPESAANILTTVEQIASLCYFIEICMNAWFVWCIVISWKKMLCNSGQKSKIQNRKWCILAHNLFFIYSDIVRCIGSAADTPLTFASKVSKAGLRTQPFMNATCVQGRSRPLCGPKCLKTCINRCVWLSNNSI